MLSSPKRNLLNIVRGVLGPLQTNTYLIKLKEKCLIVDPADRADILCKFVKENYPNTTPDILLTHGHFDHMMAIPEICKEFPKTKIFASEKDLPAFKDPALNLSRPEGIEFTLDECLDKLHFVKDGEKLNFNDVVFKILDIPGHSPGSIGFLSEEDRALFSGDTLFFGSVGNTELPRADYYQMMKSISEKLLVLPEYTQVFPGHGDDTTIGTELKLNPFIKSQAKVK